MLEKFRAVYGYGGAIYSDNSSLSIQSTLIDGDLGSPEDTNALTGGAIYASDSEVTLADCQFTRAFVDEQGSVMVMGGGVLNASSCSFTQNFTLDFSGNFLISSGDANFVDCNFVGATIRVSPSWVEDCSMAYWIEV